MKKVLIVDDDFTIRKSLTKGIQWHENNFDLVGTASDGEEALQIIAAAKPDIVISDIRMPFIDGLKLSEIIHTKYPHIKIILLSGYEEFEYALAALKYNVFDYLLKPLENEKLLETLHKISLTIDKEKNSTRQIEKSKPILCQSFLTQFIFKQISDHSMIKSQIEFLNIPLSGDGFVVLVLRPDDYKNSGYYDHVMSWELLKFSIINISKEIYEKSSTGIIFTPVEDQIVILLNMTITTPVDSSTEITQLTDEIHEMVNVLLHSSVTIGVSNLAYDVFKIPDAYQEAYSATEFRHLIGKNKTIYFHETGFPTNDATLEIGRYYTELSHCIKYGKFDTIYHIIDQMKITFMDNTYVSFNHIRLTFIEVSTIISIEVNQLLNDIIKEKTHQLLKDFQVNVFNLKTLDDIVSTLKNLIKEIFTFTTEITGQKSLLYKAIEYINTHYMEENLNLQVVADFIHITPTYLSIIFGKEHNVNFSQYLLSVRMEKAMQLLRNTDMKTYEVAERTGYTSPQYFSVCFKKYTNLSPSEYKKNTSL